jgi:peptidyl-prolyl cis-trans isomerase A (cyclophilin A)
MKSAIVLALLVLPAAAQITATFQTSRGNVLVTLQYDKTPKAVANFITLAQGTRSSYDSATGAVRPKRFYAGETFHRVLNGLGGNPDFKIAQTGTGNATSPENTGAGPGY